MRRTSRSTTRRRRSPSTSLGLVMKWLIGQGGLAANRGGQRAKGREALRRDRPHAASIAARPQKDSRSLMNVTFRLPSEDLEKMFVEGIDGGGPRRPEGPPVRRRHARVDLQRVSRGRRRRARRRSCGSSSGAQARLNRRRQKYDKPFAFIALRQAAPCYHGRVLRRRRVARAGFAR